MELGFGRYNTSTLILILVLFVATTGFVVGKFETQIANLLFAIAGYAGGVLTGQTERKDKPN